MVGLITIVPFCMNTILYLPLSSIGRESDGVPHNAGSPLSRLFYYMQPSEDPSPDLATDAIVTCGGHLSHLQQIITDIFKVSSHF